MCEWLWISIYESALFHQCADKDLVQRLSGQKQHPETGQLYNRDQWSHNDMLNKKKENKDEEAEDEEEQVWLTGTPPPPPILYYY